MNGLKKIYKTKKITNIIMKKIVEYIKEKESAIRLIEIILILSLQYIFLILKLTGIVNWSWLKVLSPLWVSQGFIFIVKINCVVFGVA